MAGGHKISEVDVMQKINRHLLSRFLMLTMLCYLVRCCTARLRLSLAVFLKHINAEMVQHSPMMIGARRMASAVFLCIDADPSCAAGPHELGICSTAAQPGPGLLRICVWLGEHFFIFSFHVLSHGMPGAPMLVPHHTLLYMQGSSIFFVTYAAAQVRSLCCSQAGRSSRAQL